MRNRPGWVVLVALLFAWGCPEWTGDDDDAADDDDTVPDDSLLTCSDVDGDEVCHDEASDLTWRRESGDTGRSWQDSIDFCDGLEFAGVDDWRIPTISELRTLVRDCPGTGAAATAA